MQQQLKATVRRCVHHYLVRQHVVREQALTFGHLATSSRLLLAAVPGGRRCIRH